MSHDSEKLKRLVSFKQKLEKKIEELESELKELQATLEAINSILIEKGFKHAEMTKTPAETEALPAKEEIMTEPSQYESVQLKAATGELLATLHTSDDSLQVVPAQDKNFNVNTPPFTPFLLERVLAKMQEKDNELARTGQIATEKAFSYKVVREGDVVREITIKNVDPDRLRELKSSIRWTFEKMYEKMQTQT
jgi:uncharacterized coiled-coil protein SlyX